MKLLVASLLVFSALSAQAKDNVNCNIHKLYCAAFELRPTIDKDFAMELSDSLHVHAKKHGVDPFLSLAIAMQESSLRQINRTEEERTTKTVCDKWHTCTTTITVVERVADFSVFQFHLATVKERDLDVERLLSDIDYAVDQHMIFLKQKIRNCKKKYPKTAWACWHSATPERHWEYVDLVRQYYKGNNPRILGE